MVLGALREHDKLAAQLTQVGEIAQHLLDTNTRLEKEKKTADKELEDQREQIEALTEQLELAELAGLDDDVRLGATFAALCPHARGGGLALNL